MRIVIVLVVLLVLGLLVSKFLTSRTPETQQVQVPAIDQQPATTIAATSPVAAPAVKPSGTPEQPESEQEIRVIQMDGGIGFSEMMEELGIGDLEERFAQWSTARGFPFSDRTGTYLLEQPYDQYDDETLRAFADNEDMWAQQFLAERLEKSRPAEALDWYRKAAINGSVHAMDRITMLYRKIDMARPDAPNTDDIYKEQVTAIRDGAGSADEMGFAWSVAAVMAGADPSRNKALSERLARNFDSATRERACHMATGLYDDISNARSMRNLDDFDRSPPPFMLGSMEDMSGTSCDTDNSTPHADFSGCEEVEVVTNGVGSRVVVCPGG